MLQQWKYAVIMVLHQNKDRAECGNYSVISLVAHAVKVLLKIIARRREDPAGGTEEWFPIEPLYYRYDICNSLATEVGLEETNPVVYMLIDLIKAYDSLDQTLLWRVLARFGVPQKISRSFGNSTMACEHACGSTTGCAWGGKLWNMAFVKGACSRPSCSASSSRRL